MNPQGFWTPKTQASGKLISDISASQRAQSAGAQAPTLPPQAREGASPKAPPVDINVGPFVSVPLIIRPN